METLNFSIAIVALVIAVLALPKLVRKSLDVRSLNRETVNFKRKIVELEKRHLGGS